MSLGVDDAIGGFRVGHIRLIEEPQSELHAEDIANPSVDGRDGELAFFHQLAHGQHEVLGRIELGADVPALGEEHAHGVPG